MQVEALGTILSVWAHPDDETFLSAGVMAAARDAGQRVVCVSATAGEHGTDDPGTWPPDRLGQVRRWEATAAMAVLGVGEHAILGLPDGGLPGRDEEGLAWVGGLLDEVGPDTILTFGPEGMTHHPDHIAVHRWVTEAWERAGRPGRLLYATPTVEQIAEFGDLYEEWGIYMTDERPAGTPEAQLALHLRLDGPGLDRKLAALRAMATQTGDVFAQVDLARFEAEIATESFVAAGRLSSEP
jgi:LmbE family N-acetylglucosaminyl deacetylase